MPQGYRVPPEMVINVIKHGPSDWEADIDGEKVRCAIKNDVLRRAYLAGYTNCKISGRLVTLNSIVRVTAAERRVHYMRHTKRADQHRTRLQPVRKDWMSKYD